MDYERRRKLDDILITAALRVDGYKLQSRHPFDHIAAQETYKESRSWAHLDPYQQLATFFFLQRYLYKWGGEMLSQRSLVWRGFIELFLLTCRLPTPEEYRDQAIDEEWTTKYLPRLDECISLVNEVYQATEYADNDFIEDDVLAQLRPKTASSS